MKLAEQWDEFRQAGEAGEAGEEFWKLLNHPATMQRQKKERNFVISYSDSATP